MKFKIKGKVVLSEEQLEELSRVLSTPDMGWTHDSAGAEMPKVYEVDCEGDHGTYTYRVNLHINLVTLLEVK